MISTPPGSSSRNHSGIIASSSAPPENVTAASHNNNVNGVQITWRRSIGEMSVGVLLRNLLDASGSTGAFGNSML